VSGFSDPERPSDDVLSRVFRGDATADEARLVSEWRRQSPGHEGEYQSLARILAAATELPHIVRASDPPRISEVVAARHDRLSAARSRWVGRSVWLAGAAAALILLALGVSRLVQSRDGDLAPLFGGEEFVTSSTETATVGLRDGTVVRLAPNSRLHLVERPNVREVSLAGRAYFAVARDPAHPFLIRTSAGDVSVLGTRFDLEARDEAMQLVVVEGRVAVAARGRRAEVKAGEMSRVVAGQTLPVIKVPDLGRTLSWYGRFLAFQETPLHDVAGEIERLYGVTVRIDSAIPSDDPVTAWFADRPLNEVLRVVCLTIVANCEVAGQTVRISPR